MKTYFEIIELISALFIKGIFISVIIIIFARKLLKENIDFNNAISIIRWMLVAYAILNLAYFVILLFFSNSDIYSSSFSERFTGEYKFVHWLMLISSFSPLFLFFRKLGRKIYFILFLSILVNIGWLFESFVIHIVSMHRDYSGRADELGIMLPFNKELVIIAKGFLVGVLAITFGNLPFFKKTNKI